MKNILKKSLNLFLYFLVIIYFIFEVFVWDLIIEPMYKYTKQFKIIQRILIFISKQNEYIVLSIFLSSFIIAEGLGYYAGHLFAELMIVEGVLVYLSKIPVGIIAFSMLKTEKEKLFKFKWFEKVYIFVEKIIHYIKNSKIYKNVLKKGKEILAKIKAKFSGKRNYFIKFFQRVYRKIRGEKE